MRVVLQVFGHQSQVCYNSPVLRSAVVSPIAAGAGHIAGGTTFNLLEGQNLDSAFGNSFKGIGKSMAIGAGLGVTTTIATSYANGINPWNGEITDLELVKRAASFADDYVPFTKNSGVTGTLKHSAANKLLQRYQNIYGDRGLEFNKYFNNNSKYGLGNKGFLDVINFNKKVIYDYKFGGADWRPGQYEKYIRNFEGFKIYKIKP